MDIGDGSVESLWVRLKGVKNKGDVMLEVYYRPPNQVEEAFFKNKIIQSPRFGGDGGLQLSRYMLGK